MVEQPGNVNRDSSDAGRALHAPRHGATPQPMNRRNLEPVFIVGQFKCGTSWLLRILSAPPKVNGVAEIDIVRAAYELPRVDDESGGSVPRLASVEDRLNRFFDRSGWCVHYDGSRWRGTDTSAQLERGGDLRTIFGDLARKPDRSKPKKFMNLTPEVATALYHRIKGAERPEAALDAFLEAVCIEAESESHVVLKAADQIAVFDTLEAWQPAAKKIVITRDGRDAAISATYFRTLMSKTNAPFGDLAVDYWKMFKAWANRADMVARRVHRGSLRVIRYEDLSYDFSGTIKPLLAWLGVEHSDQVVEAITSRVLSKHSPDGRGARRRDTSSVRVRLANGSRL